MIAWAVEFAIYAALVIGAIWLSWRRAESLIGLTLLFCLLVSEVSYFGTSLDSRVALEVIEAGVIINSARIAFNAARGWGCAAIVILSLADLAFCFTIAIGVISGKWTGYIFGNLTNAIFFAQCLCVAAPGVRDVVIGRRSARVSGRMVGCGNVALDDICGQIE